MHHSWSYIIHHSWENTVDIRTGALEEGEMRVVNPIGNPVGSYALYAKGALKEGPSLFVSLAFETRAKRARRSWSSARQAASYPPSRALK